MQLKALLEPFGITCYHTDYWGAYVRQLDPEGHHRGKRNTPQIERKHLTLWPRIKWLGCKPKASTYREKERACVRNRPITE